MAEATILKGLVLYRQHSYEQSRAAFEAALNLFAGNNFRQGEANSLLRLGDLQVRVDDLDGARGFYETALPIYREIHDRLGEANCLKSLGVLRMSVSDLDGARGSYETALSVYREIHDRLGEANCLLRLGDLQVSVGDLDGARRLFDQYDDESSASFQWSRILERHLAGDEAKAVMLLAEARKDNAFVEPYFEHFSGSDFFEGELRPHPRHWTDLAEQVHCFRGFHLPLLEWGESTGPCPILPFS